MSDERPNMQYATIALGDADISTQSMGMSLSTTEEVTLGGFYSAESFSPTFGLRFTDIGRVKAMHWLEHNDVDLILGEDFTLELDELRLMAALVHEDLDTEAVTRALCPDGKLRFRWSE